MRPLLVSFAGGRWALGSGQGRGVLGSARGRGVLGSGGRGALGSALRAAYHKTHVRGLMGVDLKGVVCRIRTRTSDIHVPVEHSPLKSLPSLLPPAVVGRAWSLEQPLIRSGPSSSISLETNSDTNESTAGVRTAGD